MFIVRDRMHGNVIVDGFETYDEAVGQVQEFESEDRANGEFSEGFYEIVTNKHTQRYIVVDCKGNDVFTNVYDSLELAIEFAEINWGRLSDSDKAKRGEYYVLEAENSDTLDGDVVYRIK